MPAAIIVDTRHAGADGILRTGGPITENASLEWPAYRSRGTFAKDPNARIVACAEPGSVALHGPYDEAFDTGAEIVAVPKVGFHSAVCHGERLLGGGTRLVAECDLLQWLGPGGAGPGGDQCSPPPTNPRNTARRECPVASLRANASNLLPSMTLLLCW